MHRPASCARQADVRDRVDSDGAGERADATGRVRDLHANVSNRQLARNFATGYLSVAVSVVSGLVVVPVTLRALGETHYGLLVVMMSVGVLLGIFDAGVGTAAVQQAARASARGDHERQADIFATSRRFFTVTGVSPSLAPWPWCRSWTGSSTSSRATS